MSDRYLRGNGNWSDAIWASTSSGSAGSAAAPTTSDTVFIADNFTLTLDDNRQIVALIHTNGRLNLSSYKLTTTGRYFGPGFQSTGTNARTLDFGSGELLITNNSGSTNFYETEIVLSGSNLTVIPGTSRVTLDVVGGNSTYPNDLGLNDFTFNDVFLNLGVGGSISTTVNITGSPTFRSLTIQSKNSAAHTVNFDSGATITTNKFVAIGSSSSNKLTIKPSSGSSTIALSSGGSSYGQFVDMQVSASGAGVPKYLGANSTQSSGMGWLLQNPPKISTLVDPLTTTPGSNTNWTVTGTMSQVTTGYEGGGYELTEGSSLTTTDTFDFRNDSFIFEVDSADYDQTYSYIGSPSLRVSATMDSDYDEDGDRLEVIISGDKFLFADVIYKHNIRFIRYEISSGGELRLGASSDGFVWEYTSAYTLSADHLLTLASSRASISSNFYDGTVIGSINPYLNQPPTVSLNSPSNNATGVGTTPNLQFTGTDPESDSVTYQLQIATDSGFSSLHTDVEPETDSGFSGTDPYTSGTQVTYTVQSALTLGVIDYWWRVRAKDPSGTNAWGDWSTARKLTTDSTTPTVTSGSSSSITTTSATVAGNVTSSGGASITERGFVYGTSSNPTTANSKKTTSGTTGAYSDSLTSLTPNTTYYWRAYAINSKGTSYGSNQTFNTPPRPPVVQIGAGSGATSDSFTVNGSTITSNPDSQSISEFGVVYSTSPNPTIANSSQTGTGTAASWNNTVGSLSASTAYYVRAYAKWGANYAYSSQITITTLAPPAPPTVTVGEPTSILDKFAAIPANVTDDGQKTVTERGIVFSENENPTTADNKVTHASGGTGVYSVTLSGLEPETEYHYRAYAINSEGTGYSSDETFTTLASFVPDEGDGYWTFSSTGSTAIVSRSQATPENACAVLPLADLPQIEAGEIYTLHVGDISADYGDPKLVLLYYDEATPVTEDIDPNSEFTFVYNLDDYHSYQLQLYVTQEDPESELLTATFEDLYLAKEAEFSEFIEFEPRGLAEVKIINNQIVDKRRQEVIDSIYSQLLGFNYYPFSADTEGLGYFEIGDGITIDDGENTFNVINLESSLRIDGGIQETIQGDAPDKTDTDYSKAGNIRKLISNTTLQVDKQNQTIQALVHDVYDNNGYVEEKFSEVYQDINEVRTTVQGAGGVNLIRNSVMYAYNNLGYPDSWTTTHVDGDGTTITIQGSPESKNAGGVSGNTFILRGVKVVQTVSVKKDVDTIPEESKTYYTLSMKVKKNLVGTAYIKLSNRNESHQIDLENGDEYYWEDFTIDALLPKDDHYDLEIYSDDDAQAQFTDVMLSIGEYRHSWTQAPGEVGNASVAITEDGITIRQDQFRYNYTKIDALGFEVHKKVLGTDWQVFGFNGDETNVHKLKSDKQIAMGGIKIVPITIDGEDGWAFTKGGNS